MMFTVIIIAVVARNTTILHSVAAKSDLAMRSHSTTITMTRDAVSLPDFGSSLHQA